MTTHECPGGCHAQVPRHLVACKPCWARLPAGLRRRVLDAYRIRATDPRPHRQALAGALAWYRDHHPGRPQDPPAARIGLRTPDQPA